MLRGAEAASCTGRSTWKAKFFATRRKTVKAVPESARRGAIHPGYQAKINRFCGSDGEVAPGIPASEDPRGKAGRPAGAMEGYYVVAQIRRLPQCADEARIMRPRTRKAPRRAVDAQAVMRTSGGDELLADLRDVSIHGCNVVVSGDAPRMGSFVTLSIGSARPVQGVVRWTRETTAGIEFLRPLRADLEEWTDLVGGSSGW